MAIQSVNVNRVTSTLQAGALLSTLRRNTYQLFTEQNRIAVGRQYLSPSEDPRRAAQALNLNEVLDQQAQMETNIRHGSNVLDATDVAMGEVSTLIIDAQAVASQNIGSLASSDERIAAAEIVASIREQLVAVGNRTHEGRYLFAGRDTNEQPFITAHDGTAYIGDTGDIYTRMDVDELEPINLPGNVLFGALSGAIRGSADLTPRLTDSVRLEDLDGALNQGIRLGSFQIVEEGGATVTVDLSNADTVGDVVDTINAAATNAGAAFTAALNFDGIGISPGGPAVTVRDISTGTTAADLGLITAEPATAVILGADLGARITRTTRIEDLAQGVGLDLTGGIVLTNGELAAEVDFSTAETVQDIMNAIDNAGVFARAQIAADGKGIEIVNTVSGTMLTVGENGGTAAEALGFRSLRGESLVAEINNGLGLRTREGKTDLLITAKDGNTFEVNLDGAVTIDDVLDAINAAAVAAGVSVTADLAAVGNGIRLTDGTGGAGNLSAGRANYSYAVDDLGLTQTVVDPETELIGTDVNSARANGVITALYDLERALAGNDSQAITIAAENLDAHQVEFNRARGLVGTRAKGMRDRLTQTENAVFATEALLSEVEDLDYTEAVTKFQQAQTALEATLMTGSQVMRTSLLDFLR